MADDTTEVHHLDYEVADTLELTDAAQYRALFDETRSQIASLLLERAATTTDLATALNRPKGTIGHHLKVMEEAGLVRVVRTQKVRALEAKYYGRTARIFLYGHRFDAIGHPARMVARAAREVAQLDLREDWPNPNQDSPSQDSPSQDSPDQSMAYQSREDQPVVSVNGRQLRIPRERAQEWADRMTELIVEFAATPTGGDTTYALIYALYPSPRGTLPDPKEPS